MVRLTPSTKTLNLIRFRKAALRSVEQRAGPQRPHSQTSGVPLLRLRTRIVLRIDVVDTPRTGAVDLNNRFFVGEEIVLRTRVQRKEATRGENLSLVVIGRRSHRQARCPGEHGDDLRRGMSVRSNVIALWRFQTKSKQAFLARVAIKHHRLRTGWEGGWRRSPFDVLWRDQFVLACLLTSGAASQRCESDRRHRGYVEKSMPIHCGFSFDFSTSEREAARCGWWKISGRMVC